MVERFFCTGDPEPGPLVPTGSPSDGAAAKSYKPRCPRANNHSIVKPAVAAGKVKMNVYVIVALVASLCGAALAGGHGWDSGETFVVSSGGGHGGWHGGWEEPKKSYVISKKVIWVDHKNIIHRIYHHIKDTLHHRGGGGGWH